VDHASRPEDTVGWASTVGLFAALVLGRLGFGTSGRRRVIGKGAGRAELLQPAKIASTILGP
jgi:hypothetical protein